MERIGFVGIELSEPAAKFQPLLLGGALEPGLEVIVLVGDLTIGEFRKLMLEGQSLRHRLQDHRLNVRREAGNRLMGALLTQRRL